jgi:hypothetical protein
MAVHGIGAIPKCVLMLTDQSPATSSDVALPKVVEATSPTEPLHPAASEKPESIATTLKAELALIALLVVFTGPATTETYYGYFGLRYQFLNLSASHILYRGITAIPSAPTLLLPYVSCFLLLFSDSRMRGGTATAQQLRSPIAYGFVVAILLLAYP